MNGDVLTKGRLLCADERESIFLVKLFVTILLLQLIEWLATYTLTSCITFLVNVISNESCSQLENPGEDPNKTYTKYLDSYQLHNSFLKPFKQLRPVSYVSGFATLTLTEEKFLGYSALHCTI